jgi:hypothetical protein
MDPQAYEIPQRLICGACIRKGQISELRLEASTFTGPEWIRGALLQVQKTLFGLRCTDPTCENHQAPLSIELFTAFLGRASAILTPADRENQE